MPTTVKPASADVAPALAAWIQATPRRYILVLTTGPRLTLEVARRTIKFGGGLAKEEWYVSDVLGNSFASNSGFLTPQAAQMRAVKIAKAALLRMAPLLGLLATSLDQ